MRWVCLLLRLWITAMHAIGSGKNSNSKLKQCTSFVTQRYESSIRCMCSFGRTHFIINYCIFSVSLSFLGKKEFWVLDLYCVRSMLEVRRTKKPPQPKAWSTITFILYRHRPLPTQIIVFMDRECFGVQKSLPPLIVNFLFSVFGCLSESHVPITCSDFTTMCWILNLEWHRRAHLTLHDFA